LQVEQLFLPLLRTPQTTLNPSLNSNAGQSSPRLMHYKPNHHLGFTPAKRANSIRSSMNVRVSYRLTQRL
jgi:hypothetical protein